MPDMREGISGGDKHGDMLKGLRGKAEKDTAGRDGYPEGEEKVAGGRIFWEKRKILMLT